MNNTDYKIIFICLLVLALIVVIVSLIVICRSNQFNYKMRIVIFVVAFFLVCCIFAVFKVNLESFMRLHPNFSKTTTSDEATRVYGIQSATSDSALPHAYCIWYDEEGRVVKYAGPVPDSVKEKEGIDF